ncbi:MAG: glutamate racemase, partial [Erysipelotrichaceae bacterium]|nr:glutamate racemase [Erysipelotrichaceae bacterium]
MKTYIGVFDSGLGGLTCVRELIAKMPYENVVFLADNKNVPYGNKTVEQIRVMSLNNTYFLNRFDLKALIIACNTSESNARDVIEENVNVPVYGVIRPAAKKAVETTRNGKIGLFATTLTVRSGKYEDTVKQFNKDVEVYSMECPKFVPLIEDGKFRLEDKETVDAVKEYIEPLLQKGIDTLILGCTHYDVLIDILNSYYPELNIVSSSRCVIDVALNDLNIKENREPERKYFTTALDERFDKVSKMIINDIEYEIVDV